MYDIYVSVTSKFTFTKFIYILQLLTYFVELNQVMYYPDILKKWLIQIATNLKLWRHYFKAVLTIKFKRLLFQTQEITLKLITCIQPNRPGALGISFLRILVSLNVSVICSVIRIWRSVRFPSVPTARRDQRSTK